MKKLIPFLIALSLNALGVEPLEKTKLSGEQFSAKEMQSLKKYYTNNYESLLLEGHTGVVEDLEKIFIEAETYKTLFPKKSLEAQVEEIKKMQHALKKEQEARKKRLSEMLLMPTHKEKKNVCPRKRISQACE